MTPFVVLSPGRFVDQTGVEIAICTFANLYHDLTPKHQKKIKLVIIEEADEIVHLEKQIAKENLKNAVNIIHRSDMDNVEAAYENASVFLFPAMVYSHKIIPEAMSFGLPILTYENPDFKDILDYTCSMLVDKRYNYRGEDEFFNYLEMLYFDPEVRKILARGAMDKYENEMNWGRKRKAEVA